MRAAFRRGVLLFGAAFLILAALVCLTGRATSQAAPRPQVAPDEPAPNREQTDVVAKTNAPIKEKAQEAVKANPVANEAEDAIAAIAADWKANRGADAQGGNVLIGAGTVEFRNHPGCPLGDSIIDPDIYNKDTDELRVFPGTDGSIRK